MQSRVCQHGRPCVRRDDNEASSPQRRSPGEALAETGRRDDDEVAERLIFVHGSDALCREKCGFMAFAWHVTR